VTLAHIYQYINTVTKVEIIHKFEI
jgi:hypothetical protein